MTIRFALLCVWILYAMCTMQACSRNEHFENIICEQDELTLYGQMETTVACRSSGGSRVEARCIAPDGILCQIIGDSVSSYWKISIRVTHEVQQAFDTSVQLLFMRHASLTPRPFPPVLRKTILLHIQKPFITLMCIYEEDEKIVLSEAHPTVLRQCRFDANFPIPDDWDFTCTSTSSLFSCGLNSIDHFSRETIFFTLYITANIEACRNTVSDIQVQFKIRFFQQTWSLPVHCIGGTFHVTCRKNIFSIPDHILCKVRSVDGFEDYIQIQVPSRGGMLATPNEFLLTLDEKRVFHININRTILGSKGCVEELQVAVKGKLTDVEKFYRFKPIQKYLCKQ